MAVEFSRRSFLKASAALAAAASVSGLLSGCGGTDSGYTLGEYKLYFGKSEYTWVDSEGYGYVMPTVRVQGVSNGFGAKFYGSIFSAAADGTELKLKNKLDTLAVVQNVPSTAQPRFITEDEDLYGKLKSGKVTLDLTVTLSAQSKTFSIDLAANEVSEKK